MGAELLIQSIGFKAKNRFLIDKKWARSAFKQARGAINAIDAARMAEINAEHEGSHADLEGYKRELMHDLAEIEAAVFSAHRAAATVQGAKGIILLLSGGMSWGDSPTELFDAMARLLEADVMPDARTEQKT